MHLELISCDTEDNSHFPGVSIMTEFTNLTFLLYFSTRIKTDLSPQETDVRKPRTCLLGTFSLPPIAQDLLGFIQSEVKFSQLVMDPALA